MLRTTEPGSAVSPTVAHILEILKSRIESGEFRSGQRLPAERALAVHFQVSRTTVRQALDTLEQQGYLVRVNGCRPIVAAANGDNRRVEPVPTGAAKRNIALWITGEPNDVGAYSTLQGIQRGLDPDQYRLVMANPRGETLSESIREEAAFLDRLAEDRDISGVILWYLGGEANRAGLERLRSIGRPMVFLDRRPPAHFGADFVGIDNRYAASQVVRHLLARGHRRIAHITNKETACTVADRLRGYLDSLLEAGIDYDPDLVLSGPFQEPEETMHSAMLAQLRGLANPPTAVFAVNDYSALCLAASAMAAGLRIPEDLEIAGFDDLERWRPGPAMLTTISQPFERMGMQAARLLLGRLDLLDGQDGDESYTNVIMDAPLVERTPRRLVIEF